MRTILAAILALALVVGPVTADQILPPGQIDGNGYLKFRGGPTLGKWQGNTYTATPDGLIVGQPGSVIPWKRGETGAVTRNLLDKLGERLSVKDFGAVGTLDPVDASGKVDDGPAIQAAINACNGCTIDVPVGIYRIATPLTGKGGIRFRGQSSVGSNIHATPSNGSILSNAQSGAALITFPGSSNLIANDASAWSFEAITLQGNNRPVPIIYAPETNPGRGSWSARVTNTLFDGGRPAISAANAWDWWVDGSSFQRCGDVTKADNAVAADLSDSCILIFNSAQTYPGANSNSWRITNNFFDITKGRAIVSDSSGAGGANQFMLVSGNHAGPTGNEFLYGCWSQSTIVANQSEGSFAGRPGINLFVPGGRSGCGQNRIVANLLTAAGTFHIVDGLAGDLIASNTMQPEGSGGAFIQLTATSLRTAVLNNKAINAANDNLVPMVADLGSGNTVRGNPTSDNKVANNEEPMRQDGVNLWGQVSPTSGIASYTPTVSCGSGSITALGSAFVRTKQVGKLVYVNGVLPITTIGSCATNIQVSLQAAADAATSFAANEAAGGKVLSARVGPGSSTVFINSADATATGAFSGATINFSGWYQRP